MFKKTLFAVAALFFALVLALGGCSLVFPVKGNGNMVKGEVKITGPITKIDVKRIEATVNISNKNSDTVAYNIDSNLEDLLEIKLVNGVLVIGTKDNKTLESKKEIVINVGTNSLKEVSASHSANIVGDGVFAADSFLIKTSGAVDFGMDIEAPDIEVRSSGACDIKLTCKAEDFTFNASGAADAKLDINAVNIVMDASGAAKITLAGAAETLSLDFSGAVDFNSKELTADDVRVKASGASKIWVFAENTLEVNGSGAISVLYWGNPNVSDKLSGAAVVKKGS